MKIRHRKKTFRFNAFLHLKAGRKLVGEPTHEVTDTLILTDREWRRLLELIENPPPRNTRLTQLLEKYRNFADASDSYIDWSPRPSTRSESTPGKDKSAGPGPTTLLENND